MDILVQIFTSPFIQLFALGALAGYFRSDLEIPESFTKVLSIYLMLAIGLKGGLEIGKSSVPLSEILTVITVAMAFSFIIPVISYAILRKTTSISRLDAAAISAHYGSVSAVTFSFAMGYLANKGIAFEGYMVTILAVMEFPAILTGLMLAKKSVRLQNEAKTRMLSGKVIREVFLNGSIVLLIGGLIIGATSYQYNNAALMKVKPYLIDPFYGILCLFLLELGLVAAKRIKEVEDFSFKLFAFGIYMPILSAILSLTVSKILGFDAGTSLLLAVLCASASYIAVPAALKIALPQANPAYYITLSLCVTFPFNLILGIPLYEYMAINVFKIMN